ncbi:MAG: hexameric tyrosine-coordinated heme protein [Pseudomonadota bacterium]
MSWLPSLMTETPEEGFDLALKLSRMGVKKTQPDDEARARMRAIYENNADSLTMASQVVALNFQTIAAANDYWR